MDEMLGQTGTSAAALAALAELAEAAADPKRRPGLRRNPRDEVPGFDSLPRGLQDTIASMDDAELGVIGKMNASLIDSGFYVSAGSIRLSMF